MPVEGVSSKHQTKNGFPTLLPVLSENFINAVQGNFNSEFHHHYHKLVFFCEKNCYGDWNQAFDWLIVLNYNFQWDRLINLSDNKLSDNNLAIELVENRSFFNNLIITSEEMIYIYFYYALNRSLRTNI